MNRVIQALKWEMILQCKYKIYLAALFVVAVWTALVAPLSDKYQSWLVPFVLFIDIAILGFYFMGAMVLFEKGQKTIQALVVTPMRVGLYFFVKILAFALLSVAVSILLILFTYGLGKVDIGLLVVGVVSNSVLYTLIGFIAISEYDSISDYLIPSWLYLFLTQLPLIDYFDLFFDTDWLHWLFFIHPMQGSLYLIKSAFDGFEVLPGVLSVITVFLWFFIFFRLAYKAFKSKILEQRTR